uniref:Uncharacterized protein n=1 Tax=Siphoviridae sp. ctwQT14 TaxID=2827971 RepID=A0A8S5TKB7_9CAUD|nr:MAG TPA: hypothetical protein [Siphoviridae sp. ctwQT14]
MKLFTIKSVKLFTESKNLLKLSATCAQTI